MQNFSCLGWLKLLNYTFPGGRPAKPEINANLSPAWLAGAWAELGKDKKVKEWKWKLNVRDKKEKEMIEREENERSIEENWELLKWSTGYISENFEQWKEESRMQEIEIRRELDEWDKLKRKEKIEVLKLKWRQNKDQKNENGEVGLDGERAGAGGPPQPPQPPPKVQQLAECPLKTSKLVIAKLKAPEKEDNPKRKRQLTRKKFDVQQNKITSMFPKIAKTTKKEDNNPINDNQSLNEKKKIDDGLQHCTNSSTSMSVAQAEPSEYGKPT